ncbi:MAG: hypothetical protein K1X85_01790 [Ignavibacteria bacterium]|nr:hypothetical protein [Ignavibacteria bacterium]
MIKSKAIEIINGLTKEELDEFRLFLDSPYFNRKKKILNMFDIIRLRSNELGDNGPAEEQVFGELFSGGKYSASFVRNLMSELLAKCREFLVVNRLKKENFEDNHSSFILLDELNRRHLDNLFGIEMKSQRKKFEKKKMDDEHFEALAKLESVNIAYHLFRSSMHKVPPHLFKRAEYNFIHFLQLFEHDLMDISVNKTAFNLDTDKEIFPALSRFIDTDKMLDTLADYESSAKEEIEIHLRLIRLGNGFEDDKNYFRLKKLLLSRTGLYTNSEAANLFIKLKNYCGFRIYGGERKFYDEKFTLGRKELEVIKFNEDGVGPLHISIYLELIQFALYEKDVAYAESVLRSHSSSLEESRRKSVAGLAEAMICFEKGLFDQSLKLLSSVSPFNTLMKVNCKVLLIRLFYELDESESGISAIESFRHYLASAKDIGESRRSNLETNLKIMRNLFRLRFNRAECRPEDLDDLSDMIRQSESRYSRWYFEKVNELKPI